MPKDKTENHEKIIAAAYDEFMKYGFADASMRRIASACGMSASGLYKHFPSKEDMFAALVEPAYSRLKSAYGELAEAEISSIDESYKDKLWDNNGETTIMMEYIYDNLNAFKLLVCKSRGTRYENYVHELALLEEESTHRYVERLHEIGATADLIPDKEFHIFVTTNINAIFQAVEHNLTREEAMRYARHIDEFNEAGWKRLFKL